jgi:hypothetical protein
VAQVVNWQKISWTGEAEVMLSTALLSESHIIKAEVVDKISTLWKIREHGFFVTRLETIGKNLELVLVAWAGTNTAPLINYLKKICINSGVTSMRFHTIHPQKLINRFVNKWGFVLVDETSDESIYRVEF